MQEEYTIKFTLKEIETIEKILKTYQKTRNDEQIKINEIEDKLKKA